MVKSREDEIKEIGLDGLRKNSMSLEEFAKHIRKKLDKNSGV